MHELSGAARKPPGGVDQRIFFLFLFVCLFAYPAVGMNAHLSGPNGNWRIVDDQVPDAHVGVATRAQSCPSPNANKQRQCRFVCVPLLYTIPTNICEEFKLVPLIDEPWTHQMRSQVQGKRTRVAGANQCASTSCRLDKAALLVWSCVGKCGWHKITAGEYKYAL